MTTVSYPGPDFRRDTDRRLWLGVAASLLLHLLLAAVLIAEPWTWREQPPPQPPVFDMVMPDPPKPPPAPAPAAIPAPEILPPLPETAVPQLQRAPVGEQSQAPPSAGDRARSRQATAPEPKPELPRPETQAPAPVPVLPQSQVRRPSQVQPQAQQPQAPARAGNREAGPPVAAGPPGAQMTQSESDYFLSQVVAAWVIDFDAPQFRNIKIYGHYRVLPDGMLAPPFGKNDPWDMHAMVNNWAEIENEPRAASFRTAIETFLRAMRLAQPFTMPPDAQGYPKILSLNFRIGDL